ncbi:UDPglucose--hexose-1-phosphate uridylyltransferase [Microcella alkaliphila]|uniref:Galactose-1-phosphate uridylyltransferase n=1 Tax=Microcella alkaliphila TaxID=279828 RepID=A0A4V2FNB3_9MICO|nr:galactose-1-phosphate uridylyltransferase [Microcella alkaliphila]RZT60679.1 UDPglucose--hexose-1-phosphate uridylyltransferase [Microcella alkaliphila]
MTHSIHSTRLADGRELIYVDDIDSTLPAPETRRADARVLDPRPATATMRQDVLTGEWVSHAAARQNRVFLPPADQDPLAPQTDANPSEIPDIYDVAVFENRSPSFGPLLEDDNAPTGLDDTAAIGLGRSRTSVGRCEVVCFAPDHEGSFGSQTVGRARTVIEAWAHRTEQLSALPGIEQVFVFENRGEEIGVTLPHPHGQIYAYPFITPRTRGLLRPIESVGDDLFARILDFERGVGDAAGQPGAGERVIASTEHFTAFVPFAARWPLEIHLLPHRHVPDLAGLTAAERDDLAPLYRRLVRALDALYDTPTPYIAAWHQAPVHSHRDSVRLMLQITSPRRAADKLKYLAGSEAAMGAFIGDVTPEAQAAFIRSGWEKAVD